MQSGFDKLLFRIAIFNIKRSFSSTFIKDKVMLKGVLCDLTPLDLCISSCHVPFSPWSTSSSAKMVLTVQTLHFTSCASKSCAPIILLSHQKTAGIPLLQESCFWQNPCLVLCSAAQQPMGGSSSVTLLLGQILCVLPASWQFVFWCVVFWPPHLCTEGWPVFSQWLHSRCPGRALGCRCCYQLMPELCAGARLQLQTNSGQPHCSHRHWHPPQSHGVGAVTSPGRLSCHAGSPSAEHRGMCFSLAIRKTSFFNLRASEKNISFNSNKSFLSM